MSWNNRQPLIKKQTSRQGWFHFTQHVYFACFSSPVLPYWRTGDGLWVVDIGCGGNEPQNLLRRSYSLHPSASLSKLPVCFHFLIFAPGFIRQSHMFLAGRHTPSSWTWRMEGEFAHCHRQHHQAQMGPEDCSALPSLGRWSRFICSSWPQMNTTSATHESHATKRRDAGTALLE